MMYQFISPDQFAARLHDVVKTEFGGLCVLSSADLVLLHATWGGYPRRAAKALVKALLPKFETAYGRIERRYSSDDSNTSPLYILRSPATSTLDPWPMLPHIQRSLSLLTDRTEFTTPRQFAMRLKDVVIEDFDGAALFSNSDLLLLYALWGGYPRTSVGKLRYDLKNVMDVSTPEPVWVGTESHRMHTVRVHDKLLSKALTTHAHAMKSGSFLFNQLGVISDYDRLYSTGESQEAEERDQRHDRLITYSEA